MYILANDADVIDNNFACNEIGLVIRNNVLIDARWNSWDHYPPNVGTGLDSYTWCPGDTLDICYAKEYAGTPEPLYLPSGPKLGCIVYVGPILTSPEVP